jgi:TetR/AcrR family fatty acid metabolism transcriptional regulator
MEQAKRESILAAACRAFARFGFKKASVDEIARDAGVAKGTVYLACDSKEDLFYQALHRELRAWVAEGAKLIDPRVPADQLLMTCSRAGIAYLDHHPLVRDLLFGQLDGALVGWRDRLEELRALGLANVVEILKLGIKQGVFRKSIDVEAVAQLLQDVQIATYIFHVGSGGERDEARLERRSSAGYDLVMHGLLAHPARAERG